MANTKAAVDKLIEDSQRNAEILVELEGFSEENYGCTRECGCSKYWWAELYNYVYEHAPGLIKELNRRQLSATKSPNLHRLNTLLKRV